MIVVESSIAARRRMRSNLYGSRRSHSQITVRAKKAGRRDCILGTAFHGCQSGEDRGERPGAQVYGRTSPQGSIRADEEVLGLAEKEAVARQLFFNPWHALIQTAARP